MKKMIDITLITGFLGSGKTTLLKEIFRKYHKHNIVYLVNDYSVHDVDGILVSGNDREVISVAGGSIFCTCKVTEFVNRLKYIRELHQVNNNSGGGLVIEASGIADPRIINTLLKESGMDKYYRLNNIICVVDPVSFPRLQQTLPNIIHQIRSASHILCNKSDLMSTADQNRIVAQLKKINEQAEIYITHHCRIDFNPLVSRDIVFQDVTSESGYEQNPVYQKYSIKSQRPVDLPRLERFIKKFPDTFLRIKGFILDQNDNVKYLDYSVSSGLTMETVESAVHPHLEFIFKSDNTEIIQNQLRLFSRQVANPSGEREK